MRLAHDDPRAQLITINDTGHNSSMDQADQPNTELATFIGRNWRNSDGADRWR